MLKNSFFYCLALCFAFKAQALPSAIDFNADDGTGDTNAVNGYARCDVDNQYYTGNDGNAPALCHRWGLVWIIGGIVKQNKWLPSGTDTTPTVDSIYIDARLPTIKELIRLYDYSGNGFNSATAYTTILGASIESAVSSDFDGTQGKRWLLSSSYRDVDGDYDVPAGYEENDEERPTGRLQVLALNIETGEIKGFEPGEKSEGAGLMLCTSLSSNGDCSLQGGHTFFYLLVDSTLLKDK